MSAVRAVVVFLHKEGEKKLATLTHEIFGQSLQGALEKGNEMGWYSVPCWFMGEGILKGNDKYPSGTILPCDYVPDIAVKSNGGMTFNYPLKPIIKMLFYKKYGPIVQFKFGGKIMRGVGSSEHMSWMTKETLSAHKGRVGIVSVLYINGEIKTFYAHTINGNLNAPNKMLDTFEEALNSPFFDEDYPVHYIINKECIETLPASVSRETRG